MTDPKPQGPTLNQKLLMLIEEMKELNAVALSLHPPAPKPRPGRCVGCGWGVDPNAVRIWMGITGLRYSA